MDDDLPLDVYGFIFRVKEWSVFVIVSDDTVSQGAA